LFSETQERCVAGEVAVPHFFLSCFSVGILLFLLLRLVVFSKGALLPSVLFPRILNVFRRLYLGVKPPHILTVFPLDPESPQIL